MSKANKHRASFTEFFLGKKNPHGGGDEGSLLATTGGEDQPLVVPSSSSDVQANNQALPTQPTIFEDSDNEDPMEEEKEDDDDSRRADSDDDDPIPGQEAKYPPFIPVVESKATPSSVQSDVLVVTAAENKSQSSQSNNSAQQVPPPHASVPAPAPAPVITPTPAPIPTSTKIEVPIPVSLPQAPVNQSVKQPTVIPPSQSSKPMNEKALVANVQQDIKLCEKLFTEDRIGEAYFLLNNIEKFTQQLSETAQDQIRQTIFASVKIKDLRKQGQELQDWLNLLADNSVWNAWNTSMGPNQDVTVFTHRDEKEGEYFFKIEGYLHCSMLEAIATVLETDLHHLWIPMCTNNKVIQTVSNYQRIVKTDVDFVLLKKSAVTTARGDVLPDGRVLLSMKALEDKKDNKLLFPKDPQQRLNISGCILLSEESVAAEDHKGKYEEVMTLLSASKDSVQFRDSPTTSNNRGQRNLSSMKMSSAEVYQLQLDDIYLGGMGQNDSNPTSRSSPLPGARRRTSVSSWFETPTKKTFTSMIKVSIILQVDLMIDFIPDWIFNLAVRSAISMMIPMMEHHSSFFQEQGYYHHRLKDEQKDLYQELERRLQSSNSSK